MWSGNVKTAIANVRLYKWRSLLTMMGIIIGVSSVITVISLGEGLKQQVLGQINQLGRDVVSVRSGKLVSNQNDGATQGLNILALLSSSTLTKNDIEALKKIPSQKAVVPIDFVTNTAKTGGKEADNIFVVGTSPDMASVMNQKIEFGDFFQEDTKDSNFAVIGANIAQQLFGELNPIGQSVTIMGNRYVVYGVLERTSGGLFSVTETDFNSAIFIPFNSAKDLTGGSTNILQILVKGKDSNTLDKTVSDVRKALLKTHQGEDNFTVLKQYQLLNIANGVVNTITSFISGIAAISLLVGGIGIMDIMLVSVSERTREIGVRKAIGATNRQILNQFLVEGLTLTVGGGLIGILAALIINLGLKLYTNLDPIINFWTVILAVSVSVVVGLVFSVAPALKAARKDPIKALRGD